MSWSPPSSLMHTRPWRSSPLAGPGFSTLPPIISESSEESHEADFDALGSSREFGQTQRSPSSASIVSDSLPPSTSGYGSRNASASASALLLADGEASTSSISLYPNSSANGSSHGHGSSQTHSHRPARLIKSPGRRPSSAQGNLAPRNLSETSITPPPRARTVSHGHSRSISLPFHPVSPSPTIPQAYSPTPSRPTSPESHTTPPKPPPSISRDPASNWMSASPPPSLFGQRMTPRFSRLTMASPAVVMPLSAKEYRMQKARDPLGNGKGKEKDPPTSSNHVTFTDNAVSAVQTPNGLPLLKISPPPSELVHRPSPSSLHGPDPRPQVDHHLPRPLLHASISTQSQSQSPPSSPRYKRSRSRPITPPRSSPLTSHPPISPKSSTGTFFSLASSSSSSSDDDATSPPPSHPYGTDDPNAANTIPPARLRPRSRSRSYPDRLSNGARLSLLEAMNHLSQESTPLHRLSSHSQTDGANRLSMVSQTSGHTLFYDVESDGEGQERDGDGGQQRTSVLRTKSLEDFSTHARTGIEVVRPDGDGDPDTPLDDERRGERNMRVVRISDTVEVSPAPTPRRRKLTKSRPGLACGSAPGPAPGTGTALETIQETKVQAQTHERRVSLLPWKSKGSGGGTVSAHSEMASADADEKSGEDGRPSTLTKGVVHPNETTAPTSVPVPIPIHSRSPTPNGSARVESPSKLRSNTPTKKSSSDTPPSTSTSTPSTTPRKARRFTFSFLPSPNFRRPKREKSNTTPARADPGVDQHDNTKGKPEESSVKGVENGTDSTSTSICTITQGSQSTLTPESPMLSDPTTLSSSGCSSAVPMLRRLNAQAMAAGVPPPSEWDGGGDSTPSLITDGSTATLSSVPRTLPSFVRLPGGEPFVPQPSGLKASLTDTSEEEDVEGAHGKEERTRMARVCIHRRQDPRVLALETSEEDDQMQLCVRSSSGVSIGAGLSPSPRPSTPSSMLTTATETSGSYMSFGTIPASTTSSSSTSRSASPSLMIGDKRDRVVSVSVPLGSGGGDGDVYTCALCGQLVPRSISSPPSHFATGEPDQAEIHPMFTVPLVTVPMSVMSAVGTYPRRDVSMGNDGRFIARRKSERQLSVPAVPPARSGHMNARVNGGYVPGSTGAASAAPTALTTKSPSVSTSPSPSKVRRRRRPQTAPAGTGNATSKFIEDMRVTAVRERSVDDYVGVGAGVGGDRAAKPKSGSVDRESKLKTALKGLLKWNN